MHGRETSSNARAASRRRCSTPAVLLRGAAPASMQIGRHMLGGMPPHAVYSASFDLGTPTACAPTGAGMTRAPQGHLNRLASKRQAAHS